MNINSIYAMISAVLRYAMTASPIVSLEKLISTAFSTYNQSLNGHAPAPIRVRVQRDDYKYQPKQGRRLW